MNKISKKEKEQEKECKEWKERRLVEIGREKLGMEEVVEMLKEHYNVSENVFVRDVLCFLNKQMKEKIDFRIWDSKSMYDTEIGEIYEQTRVRILNNEYRKMRREGAFQ